MGGYPRANPPHPSPPPPDPASPEAPQGRDCSGSACPVRWHRQRAGSRGGSSGSGTSGSACFTLLHPPHALRFRRSRSLPTGSCRFRFLSTGCGLRAAVETLWRCKGSKGPGVQEGKENGAVGLLSLGWGGSQGQGTTSPVLCSAPSSPSEGDGVSELVPFSHVGTGELGGSHHPKATPQVTHRRVRAGFAGDPTHFHLHPLPKRIPWGTSLPGSWPELSPFPDSWGEAKVFLHIPKRDPSLQGLQIFI